MNAGPKQTILGLTMKTPQTKNACPRCGRRDRTVKQLIGCPDCADGKTFSKHGWPVAPVCELCCPTGHGTRFLPPLRETESKGQSDDQQEEKAVTRELSETFLGPF